MPYKLTSLACAECGASFIGRSANGALKRPTRFCSLACREASSQTSVAVRFWSYVDKNGPIPTHAPELGPCWVWTGANDFGYGKLGIWSKETGQRMVKAHRWALEQKLGRPLLPDMKALHHCDNKPCVRDTHLYEGTTQDNSDDAVERGRMPYGERNSSAKLTDAQGQEIRVLYAMGARQVDIANQFGVTQSHVSAIVLKKGRWK